MFYSSHDPSLIPEHALTVSIKTAFLLSHNFTVFLAEKML
jgi:hypothetical protein